MSNLPANISIANAKLPQTYEAAKVALSNCASIDECQSWADRAEALASYAKQADDETLRKLADRIQARAVRRAGELLKTFNNGVGRPGNREGSHPISVKAAGDAAGLSEYQRKTAVRVANVPVNHFEASVEGDTPPTVTKLAEMGKRARPAPEGFQQATHLLGTVRRFAQFCDEYAPEFVAGGVMASEANAVRQQVATIDAWLDRFVVNLKD